MATKIEWATEVWNPVTGCTPVSPGCDHCYAKRMANRLAGRYGYPGGSRDPGAGPFRPGTFHEDKLDEPLHWRRRRRIFVVSMGDLFHADVPDRFIERVFAVMASCGQHTFMLLTKRPERMRCWFGRVDELGPRHANHYQSALIDYYSRHGVDLNLPFQAPARPTPELRFIYDSALGVDPGSRTEDRPHAKRLSEYHWRPWPLNNVCLGVTAENQAMADERMPVLREIPAARRFVSCEPLLSDIDLGCGHESGGAHGWVPGQIEGLDWVIAGGESGPGARPSHPDWFRSLRDQCKDAGVPFMFKQWGAWATVHDCDALGIERVGNGARNWGTFYGNQWVPGVWDSTGVAMQRVGRKAAGRLLDGVVHDARPKETT